MYIDLSLSLSLYIYIYIYTYMYTHKHAWQASIGRAWAAAAGSRRLGGVPGQRERELYIIHVYIYIYIYIYIMCIHLHVYLSLSIYIYIFIWYTHVYTYYLHTAYNTSITHNKRAQELCTRAATVSSSQENLQADNWTSAAPAEVSHRNGGWHGRKPSSRSNFSIRAVRA